MIGSALSILDLGRRSYAEVENLQEQHRARVLDGDRSAEILLMVEHPPVVTLGRRADERDLRASAAVLRARGIALHRSSRGGEATYHGPGQVVAYPIISLRAGVVAHVEALASAAIWVAASFGVEATYDRAHPGVWVGGRKLASIGVHIRRRVTIHGIALNVTEESVAGFSSIVPCGMPTVQMTSLSREAGRAIEIAKARVALASALAEALR